ncbi:MAG: hypothetical protein J2P48_08335 [Alphaproteobacteria bacterium]|nr:hypothetical protein [Alphaproteobacteria bacterium]
MDPHEPKTLFAEIGMHLYGECGFSAPLAEVLGVGQRTVERWASGKRGVPPFVWPLLVQLLRDKEDKLGVLAADLERRCRQHAYPQRQPLAQMEIDQ